VSDCTDLWEQEYVHVSMGTRIAVCSL
jgi:hypothetical protein